MTDTTDWPAIPGMYAGRYTLKDRHLYCEYCGTPHLPDTAIHIYATPPTEDELRGYLHMHEIAHLGTAIPGQLLTAEPDPRIDDIVTHLAAIATDLSAIREHLENSNDWNPGGIR